MLSLPPELLIKIIYDLRASSINDLHTLRSLPLVCAQFSHTIHKYHRDIIEYYTVVSTESDSIRYRFCGKLHRGNDLPAVINTTGDRSWMLYGKWHRENDLPAVIRGNGARYWYYQGKLHRDNGKPAIIHKNMSREWWVHGVCVPFIYREQRTVLITEKKE
jgi:hypothetical protein